MKTDPTLRRLLQEWCLTLIFLVVVVSWLSGTHWMRLANNYAYDRLLSSAHRPADDRIVLIQVDERSLAELGHWPWPRRTHAALLNVLAAQSPRAVLLDVVLTEPAPDPADDHALALALSKSSPPLTVAIPVLMQDNQNGALETTLPTPELAQAAHLGHIAILPDEDGVVRSVSLQQIDSQQTSWPLLTTLMLDSKLDNNAQQSPSPTSQLKIPFNVKPNSYLSFSYADVLKGLVPQGMLTDKYVLIGATAMGLGDQYPTPSSGFNSTMPGIEIHANILDALLNHLSITTLQSIVPIAVIACIPVVLLLTLLLWLRERYHLLGFFIFLLSYTALVCGLLWLNHFWLPPASSSIGLIAAYVLWSWRRLSVTLRHVTHELDDLHHQTGHLFQISPEANAAKNTLFRPHMLELNIEHVQHLGHFVTDSLQQLPFAVLLIDSTGQVLMHNQKAQQWLNGAVDNKNVYEVMQQFDARTTHWQNEIKQDWPQLQGRELQTDGHTFELHVVSIQAGTLWQICWLDLSNERAAQQQRNDLMAFMSHDLRTPQVSILALIQIYNTAHNTMKDSELTQHIATKVHDTLNAANGLVLLARAQDTNSYTMTDANLVSMLYNAMEQVWAQATAKNIDVSIDDSMNEHFDLMWLQCDEIMLTRAWVNLLSNAVRYSANDTHIHIKANAQHNALVCTIQDQGFGMPPAQVHRLNQMMRTPFARFASNSPSSDEAGSLGVGLHMVATVLAQHKAQLQFTSTPGQGTTATIRMPTHASP